MAVRNVIPSTLVRALERHALHESSENGSDERVTQGLVYGTRTTSGFETVAIWSILADLSLRDTVEETLPGGVFEIGTITLWARGTSAVDDEATERDAAAVLAKKATGIVTGINGASMVYCVESKRLHLFDSDHATVALEVVDCLHASKFIQATESVMVRGCFSFTADSVAQLDIVKHELEDSNNDAPRTWFQFPELRQRVFNQRGVDVATTTSADPFNGPLSSLMKVPEKKTAAVAMSKSQRKKANAQAASDGWDTSSSSSTKSTATSNIKTDFWAYDEGDDSDVVGYLKTLEFGDIVNVQVLQSLGLSTGTPSKQPTVAIPKGDAKKVEKNKRIEVDAVAIVPQSASVAELIAVLRQALTKQIKNLASVWTANSTTLVTTHVTVPGVAFPFTLPTIDGTLATSIIPQAQLATALLVPPGHPVFDVSRNSLITQAGLLSTIDVLFNVHEGIPSSGVPNGTQYLVDGFYGYYHYMQQSMNDKGWGCAYRSLQTLASWLYWNNYTTTPTLSHQEIQQTLVKIGDKPSSFVGSREWIGSMEVGFVLDELFGISFRSLNVASGPQLVDKAQELKHHFETQGTPVMMGGGNLAFTLLGIDYNASSGECAFLILDPHYVGAEDLETIQTKTMSLEGYKAVPCGWRKASTFAKNSFYNLCLPQRPQL